MEESIDINSVVMKAATDANMKAGGEWFYVHYVSSRNMIFAQSPDFRSKNPTMSQMSTFWRNFKSGLKKGGVSFKELPTNSKHGGFVIELAVK